MTVIKTPKDDLLLSLAVADLNDDEMFQEMITQINPFLNEFEMARVAGCTVSTVQRWINKTACPHATMRHGLIDKFLKEIK